MTYEPDYEDDADFAFRNGEYNNEADEPEYNPSYEEGYHDIDYDNAEIECERK